MNKIHIHCWITSHSLSIRNGRMAACTCLRKLLFVMNDIIPPFECYSWSVHICVWHVKCFHSKSLCGDFLFACTWKLKHKKKSPTFRLTSSAVQYKIETKPNEQTLEVLERQEICTHSSWESHAYCMHERWTLRPCAALRQNFVNFIAFRQRLCHKSQWGFLRFCWLPFAVQPEAKSNTLRSPCVQVQSFSH